MSGTVDPRMNVTANVPFFVSSAVNGDEKLVFIASITCFTLSENLLLVIPTTDWFAPMVFVKVAVELPFVP